MVLTRDELTAIAELAVERDLIVVTDEVYEHILFEGEHIPIVSLPGMRERTVSISSAGKTFSFTGWKIGWVTGTADLVAAVRTTKQFLTFVSGGPFQYAIATGLGMADAFYVGLADDLRRKRDLLAAGLAQAGFDVFPPQGTYFITTDISPLGEQDGVEFCRALPRRCGVVAVPNAVFYDDAQAGRSQVRFAFCKRDEILAEAAARLQRIKSS
jgi:N-succinyldiaminopimelate aminotransferase